MATRTPEGAPRPVRNILVPVDLSTGSEELVRWAAWHGRAEDAAVTLLYVVDLGEMLWESLPPQYGRASLEHGLKVGAQAALAHLAGEAAAAPAIRIESGGAAERIVGVARELGADLIVLGTHGHGDREGVSLGGTADKVLRNAPCPVFLVPLST